MGIGIDALCVYATNIITLVFHKRKKSVYKTLCICYLSFVSSCERGFKWLAQNHNKLNRAQDEADIILDITEIVRWKIQRHINSNMQSGLNRFTLVPHLHVIRLAKRIEIFFYFNEIITESGRITIFSCAVTKQNIHT